METLIIQNTCKTETKNFKKLNAYNNSQPALIGCDWKQPWPLGPEQQESARMRGLSEATVLRADTNTQFQGLREKP